MALSGLEQLLIGCGIAAISSIATGVISRAIVVKDTVPQDEFDELKKARKEKWEEHDANCAINRQVLTEPIHAEKCKVVHEKLAAGDAHFVRLENKMDRMLDEQRKMLMLIVERGKQ